jgi:hypothetical protein
MFLSWFQSEYLIEYWKKSYINFAQYTELYINTLIEFPIKTIIHLHRMIKLMKFVVHLSFLQIINYYSIKKTSTIYLCRILVHSNIGLVSNLNQV